MSDSDQDSEYHSSIEEEEFRLYAELYFEPNPDYESNVTLPNSLSLSPVTNGEEHSELESNAQNISSQAHQQIRNFSLASRERTLSICSVESISGNKPLDDLYSQSQISDEEIEQLGLGLLKNQCLAPVDEEEISERGVLKRKRSASSSSDGEEEVTGEEEDEESRCSLILSKTRKTKTKATPINIDDGDGRTHSFDNHSEDIVLLPSPELHKVSVIDLSSDSEDVLDVASDKNAKPYASSQENDSKSKVKSKGKKSMDYINTQKEKSSKKNKKIKKSRRTSHSDTDSFSESEMQLFTPLTMNVDQNISKHFRGTKDDDDIQFVPTTPQRTVDYTKGRVMTVKTPSCAKWTAEMATFYDSDVSEDLSVEDVHQQQSDCRRDWKIISADNPIQWGRRYFNSKRCTRCRQFDHTVKECPRVPVCHLCSQSDHTQRHQCPKNCCLRCGGKPHHFCTDTVLTEECYSCGYTGHRAYLCPEQWRRFHITTSGEEAKAPSTLTERPKSRQYCSICGQCGHYNYNCINNYSEHYSPVPQTVGSYDGHNNVVLRGETSVPEMEYELPSESSPVVKKKMTTVNLKHHEVGRVMGRRGVIIKEIQKRSKSRLIVNTDNIDQPKVEIYGSQKKQTIALGLVQVLLGDQPPEDFTDFLTKVSVINEDPHIIESVLATYRKKTKKTKKILKGKLTKGIKPKNSSNCQETPHFSNNLDPNEIDEYDGPKISKKRKKMKLRNMHPNECDGLKIPKKGKKKNTGKKGRKCKHRQAKSQCSICKDNRKTKKKKAINASTSSQNEYPQKDKKKRRGKNAKLTVHNKTWKTSEPFIHWTKLNGL